MSEWLRTARCAPQEGKRVIDITRPCMPGGLLSIAGRSADILSLSLLVASVGHRFFERSDRRLSQHH